MHAVTVIEDPAAAEASLDPIRARLLAELAEPGSASTLAARVGLTRQKANYHLRALERHGLVELVEERRKGNCTERGLQATAASYAVSPAAALSRMRPRTPPQPGGVDVPDGDGDPRRRDAAGRRSGHDLGPAQPPRDPHGVAGRDLQRARLRDRGPRRRHRAPALRPQR